MSGLVIRIIRNHQWWWNVGRLADGGYALDLGPISIMWRLR